MEAKFKKTYLRTLVLLIAVISELQSMGNFSFLLLLVCVFYKYKEAYSTSLIIKAFLLVSESKISECVKVKTNVMTYKFLSIVFGSQ